ncbi:MAG: TPM domain-containing protein [Eubacteriales bacterium]|nr:TPM domain-containing protein [Eubacteriales bacterium]
MRKSVFGKIATAFFVLLTTLLAFSLISICAFADALPRVVDNANLLTQAERETLENKSKSIYSQYGFDIVMLTVDSVGDGNAEDIAFNFYRDNGYGYGNGHNGAILLVSADRNYAFVVCGSGQSVLKDSRLDKVEDKTLGYLRNNDYYGAYNCFVTETENYLFKDNEAQNAPKPIFSLGWFLSFTIAGIVIASAVTLTMRYRMKTARARNEAGNYVRHGSFQLKRKSDIFLYITRTRVRIQTDNNSSSGRSSGGGGSISHSGRSGKF